MKVNNREMKIGEHYYGESFNKDLQEIFIVTSVTEDSFQGKTTVIVKRRDIGRSVGAGWGLQEQYIGEEPGYFTIMLVSKEKNPEYFL